jgi:two-component system, chemotaxis family, chemotaxis protein CheY
MPDDDLNFSNISFLVAESDINFRQLVSGILRGFGAGTISEAETASEAMSALSAGTIDFVLTDSLMPGINGFDMVRTIRANPENPARFIPFIVMMSHTPMEYVVKARDCGANIVIAKPFSPAILYHRLAWVARDERQFIIAPTYIGPDRRFKIEGYPDGVGRRAEDQQTDVGDESGPAMSQEEIDALFS